MINPLLADGDVGTGVYSVTDFNVYSMETLDDAVLDNYFKRCGYYLDHDVLLSWQDMAASNQREDVVLKSPSRCKKNTIYLYY